MLNSLVVGGLYSVHRQPAVGVQLPAMAEMGFEMSDPLALLANSAVK